MFTRAAFSFALAFAVTFTPPGSARAEAPRAAAGAVPAAGHDGQHDFDFLFGEWEGAQHRLRKRLANSNEWDDFDSHLIVRPVLGGRANTDQIVFKNGPSAGGATFRIYDPQRQTWSIYWIGTTSYTLEPPVTGHFVGNRGEFYGDDSWEGKPIRVRFIWIAKDLTHCHWEQAFSTDGGKSWETNWSVELTRSAF